MAELCWPSSHTTTLEACLEEGRRPLDGLAGGRRAIGQGKETQQTNRMYQVERNT